MLEVLTKQEIRDLTGKQTIADQKEELNHLLIDCRTRADGSLLVFLKDVFPPTQQNKAKVLNLEAL